MCKRQSHWHTAWLTLCCRSLSSTSDANQEAQKLINADALRIHTFIAVAMAAGASCSCFVFVFCFYQPFFFFFFFSFSVFHINTRAHVLYAVILCKFIVVKMRGGNLALARAAEMMLLASLFTVQVTSRCSMPVVVCLVTRHTLHLNIN